jgi:hypothetical protein
MRTTVAIGFVLVIAGAAALILYMTGAFDESASLAIGQLELEASRERSMPWLPWASGGAIIAGALLMVTGRRG